MSEQTFMYWAQIMDLNLTILKKRHTYWFRWCDLLSLLDYKHTVNPRKELYSKGPGCTVEQLATICGIERLIPKHTITFNKYKKKVFKAERTWVTIDFALQLVIHIAKSKHGKGSSRRGFSQHRTHLATELVGLFRQANNRMQNKGYKRRHRIESFAVLTGERPAFCDYRYSKSGNICQHTEDDYVPQPAAPLYVGAEVPSNMVELFLSALLSPTITTTSNRERALQHALAELKGKVNSLFKELRDNHSVVHTFVNRNAVALNRFPTNLLS